MADLNLTDLFLTAMTTYGPVTLGVAMFMGTLGIPVPLPILALAAGAFARLGSINWVLALVLALTGEAIGDSIGYMVGRFASQWAQRRFGGSPAWDKARDRFHRNGGLAIYLTRFIFTPLAVPTNLIAGISRYPYHRFLLHAVGGTLTFILIFGATGYAFGRQWEAVGKYVSSYFGWLIGAALVAAVVYFLVRRWYQNRRSRATRPAASEPNQ